jgi:pyruvate formate lyase activating enzyme
MPAALSAGWKGISTVDVHGAVTFTVWFCGCNLKCPFCHNWKVAERIDCRLLDIDSVAGELERARGFIDYVHITGGEPLIQTDAVAEIFKRAKRLGVSTSLNTNATLHKPLSSLIERGLIDHVATDAKIPPEIYGVPNSESLWRMYLTSLRTIASRKIPLELRIPVGKFPLEVYERYLAEVRETLGPGEVTVVVNPLLGPPTTMPRDPAWCREYCNPSREQLEAVAKLAQSLGRVYIKRWGLD